MPNLMEACVSSLIRILRKKRIMSLGFRRQVRVFYLKEVRGLEREHFFGNWNGMEVH